MLEAEGLEQTPQSQRPESDENAESDEVEVKRAEGAEDDVSDDQEAPEAEGGIQLDEAEKRFEDLSARVATLMSDMRDLGSGVEAMESAVNAAGKEVKTLSVKKVIRPGSADEKVIRLEKMIRFLVEGMPSRKGQFNELFPPEKSEE